MESMGEQDKNCERCGAEVSEDDLCPNCDEPAPRWLVSVVYGLVALFVIGLLYRLIWP